MSRRDPRPLPTKANLIKALPDLPEITDGMADEDEIIEALCDYFDEVDIDPDRSLEEVIEDVAPLFDDESAEDFICFNGWDDYFGTGDDFDPEDYSEEAASMVFFYGDRLKNGIIN